MGRQHAKKGEDHLLATDDPRWIADTNYDTNESRDIISQTASVDNPVIIEIDAVGERFIQIGVTALRDPKTGGFLPAEPLFIKVPQAEIRKSGLARREENLLDDVAQIAADVVGKYIQLGGLRAGV